MAEKTRRRKTRQPVQATHDRSFTPASQKEPQPEDSPLAELIQRVQADPDSLRPGDVIRLQRMLGNHAVSQLLSAPVIQPGSGLPGIRIQRKPADINNTYTLDYDTTGKLTNKGAGRAALKGAQVINAQMRDGWVTPNVQLIGGHLFKREFGGPDDVTNVVPWKEDVEKRFTTFEDNYKEEADKEAQQKAATTSTFAATVKTGATFVDRPDLKVSDTDLDSAGWGATDPGRKERKDKYDDVAEQFSGIPTSVSVEVTGLGVGKKSFAAVKAEISPDYLRNDAAVKPGYKVPTRYERNATKTRNFKTMGDWNITKKPKTMSPEQKNIQKKVAHELKHGAVFGFPENKPAHLPGFEAALQTFVLDTSHEQIVGKYKAEDVLHYIDHGTKKWVSTTEDGDLVGAWMLSQTQYDSLVTTGMVK